MLTPCVLKYLTLGNTSLDLTSADRTLGIKQLIAGVKSELYQLAAARKDQ